MSIRKGKILLVDDDPGLLKLLTIRLKTEGYDIEAVASGDRALDHQPRHDVGQAGSDAQDLDLSPGIT